MQVRQNLVKSFCGEIGRAVKKLKWTLQYECQSEDFEVAGVSVKGRPLIYSVFGDPAAENTTLIFSMVHGDEVTPLYISMRLMQWLKQNIDRFPSTRVVLAPLVNPDGFLAQPRTRVNANGIDVNRNFNTFDWKDNAVHQWKRKYSSNPRRNPGKFPESEPETIFQRALIDAIRPQKILSLHAPLNFMDYDGPTVLALKRFPRDYVRKCLQLRKRMQARSGGFFPGSLGNYAGQERGIPTLTLELPTANFRLAPLYWKRFKEGIESVILFRVPDYVPAGNPSSSQDIRRLRQATRGG